MVIECLPGFSSRRRDGVSFPVSLPSSTIAAPDGLLETETIAVICDISSDTVELAPEANDRVRFAAENPDLVAETECCPGAIPVNLHGVWHSAEPSKLTSAPSGTEFTVSCAGTTVGSDRDPPFRALGLVDEAASAGALGCVSSALSSGCCASGAAACGCSGEACGAGCCAFCTGTTGCTTLVTGSTLESRSWK